MNTNNKSISSFLNCRDFENAARDVLSPMAWAYYSSGACDEITIRANETGWNNCKLWPRMLQGVSAPDLKTTLMGHPVAFPIFPAPVAMMKLAHPEGELAVVRAMGELGLPFIASTMATTSLEEIAQAATGPKFFQLYVFQDKGLTRELIQRASAAKYDGIILTVDAQMLGKREADSRQHFHLPADLRLENLTSVLNKTMLPGMGSGAVRIAANFDASLCWNDLEKMMSITDLPWAIKGILHPEDARQAIASGMKAIFVSNHGGRQLDTVPTGLESLPGIVEAVANRAEIFVDGGVRRGTDAIKAICLGAKAVLVGKPVLWALAAGGQQGVQRLFQILHEEMRQAMCLLGCGSVHQLCRDYLFPQR